MSPKSFKAVWLKFSRDESRQEFCFPMQNIVEIPIESFYFGRGGSCQDSRRHPGEILAAEKLLPGKNLDKICRMIPAKFWPLGFLFPGEIRSRISARFWPPRFLLPGENHREIHCRIPARFWPLGISLTGGNLAGIPSRFSPREKIVAAKISPGCRRDSRRDPGGIPPRSRSLILQG